MNAATAFDELVTSVLVLEDAGADEFVGHRPAASIGRIYGGEVAAQGMRAAASTTEAGRAVHSLHINYLRLGDPHASVHYRVQRLRDSTHFSTRFVRAEQGDQLIASMTVSFQRPWSGLDNASLPRDLPASLPDPESLPRRSDALAAAFGADLPAVATVPWPIDIRYLDHYPWSGDAHGAGINRLWVKADGRLGDDALEHACVLTYASDLTMYEPVVSANPEQLSWLAVSRGDVRGASLDHIIWLHRPLRVDEWLLHEHESPVAHGARALALGRYYDREGRLVASVAQETALFVEPNGSHTGDGR